MVFYRLATQEDFEQYLAMYDFVLRGMSDETRKVCMEDLEQATRKHMIETDKDRHGAYKACQVYIRYAKAKSDFDRGVNVYIQY